MLFKSVFVAMWLSLAILFAPQSEAAWFRDTQAPTIPGGVTASPASASQIDLTWTTSRDNIGVKGYRVFKNGSYAGSVTGTKYSSTGLASATAYSFTVAAYDAAGNTSRKSATVTATTKSEDTGGGGGGQASDVIGYVGCSMTMNAVNGAHILGSNLFWYPINEIGGGGPAQWGGNLSNTSKWWSAFDQSLAAQPVKTIWWELCSVSSTASSETYDMAVKVLNEIKRRIPGVTVYVSSQPDYLPADHECPIAGTGGPERMAALASQLVANGLALQGPVVGPLNYPEETLDDGCHGNDAGNDRMGQQLIDFFLTKPQASAGIASGVYVVDTEPNVSSALASQYVDGLLVRVRWEQLEPTEGVYNFKPLCDKIAQAHKLGKAVSIVNYPLPPAWLLAKVPTSEQWSLPMGKSVQTINPWNATGLAAMKKLAEAEANYQCEGFPIKAHPSVAQVDTTIMGALSVRDKPASATQAQMTDGVQQSVKIWHDAYAVPKDAKAYYFSTFPYRDKTVDAGAIVKEVLKVYPLQHTMVENWGVAGVGDTSVLKLAQFKIVQACGYFSNSKIQCSDTGRTDNTPQNAFEKVLDPLGGVMSIQVYADDVVNAAYAKDMAFLHDKLKPAAATK